MTKEEMAKLRVGDLIRHKHSSEAVVITATYGERLVAVRTYSVSNPAEWDVVSHDD